jgi:hypothetical protein
VNSQNASELELMKEKYFKILLDEDISGAKMVFILPSQMSLQISY